MRGRMIRQRQINAIQNTCLLLKTGFAHAEIGGRPLSDRLRLLICHKVCAPASILAASRSAALVENGVCRRLGEAMAKSAISELQQQIEEVRREAFAAGYAAAMQAVRVLASRPAPGGGAFIGSRGAARRNRAAGPPSRPRAGASQGARPRRTRAQRPQRGGNAERVQEILEAAAPRALRQAEIRKAMLDKGIEISFTSVRQALRQLEARSAAEQVGDSKTWRHSGGAT